MPRITKAEAIRRAAERETTSIVRLYKLMFLAQEVHNKTRFTMDFRVDPNSEDGWGAKHEMGMSFNVQAAVVSDGKVLRPQDKQVRINPNSDDWLFTDLEETLRNMLDAEKFLQEEQDERQRVIESLTPHQAKVLGHVQRKKK